MKMEKCAVTNMTVRKYKICHFSDNCKFFAKRDKLVFKLITHLTFHSQSDNISFMMIEVFFKVLLRDSKATCIYRFDASRVS